MLFVLKIVNLGGSVSYKCLFFFVKVNWWGW